MLADAPCIMHMLRLQSLLSFWQAALNMLIQVDTVPRLPLSSIHLDTWTNCMQQTACSKLHAVVFCSVICQQACMIVWNLFQVYT